MIQSCLHRGILAKVFEHHCTAHSRTSGENLLDFFMAPILSDVGAFSDPEAIHLKVPERFTLFNTTEFAAFSFSFSLIRTKSVTPLLIGLFALGPPTLIFLRTA